MGMRASDAERDACTALLRDAYAAGRLDDGELEDRIGLATVARTRSQLALLTADVPRPLPAPARRPPAWVRTLDRIDRTLLRAHATAFGITNGSFVAIWVGTGGGDFWPAWLLVPWAPLLAWHAGGSWSVRRLVRGRAGGHPRGFRARRA